MRKTAAIFSWVLFTLLAFVSLIATPFIGWGDGSSSGRFLDYYSALMLPGVFLILGLGLSQPLTKKQTLRWCATGGALYIPVVIYAIPNGLTLVAVLVLVPSFIVFMGVD